MSFVEGEGEDNEMDYDDGDGDEMVVRQNTAPVGGSNGGNGGNGGQRRQQNQNQNQPRQDFKSAVVFGTDSQTDAHTDDMLRSYSNNEEDWDGNNGNNGSGNNGTGNRNSKNKQSNTNAITQIHHDSNPNMAQAAHDEDKKQFRTEFSSDHPLAGGSGKYKKEKSAGLKPLLGQSGSNFSSNSKNSKKKSKRPNSNGNSNGNANDVVVFKSTKQHPDNAPSLMNNPQKYLDSLRKDQNESLLKLLENERFQEDERINALKLVAGKEIDERNRLELVFAEERRRASERIIHTTRMHEKKLKDAVIAVELGRSATSLH